MGKNCLHALCAVWIKIYGNLANLIHGRFSFNCFYPSARWARRGIVVPFVRRRRRTHSFGYYTNMVQQIKFIIYTDIQPSWHIFLPKVKVIGQRSRSKNYRNSSSGDNLKNNHWISPIFYVKLPMSMKMTWLEFQLSTDNQNGRHLATNFF